MKNLMKLAIVLFSVAFLSSITFAQEAQTVKNVKNQNSNWVDANGDGICDNFGTDLQGSKNKKMNKGVNRGMGQGLGNGNGHGDGTGLRPQDGTGFGKKNGNGVCSGDGTGNVNSGRKGNGRRGSK